MLSTKLLDGRASWPLPTVAVPWLNAHVVYYTPVDRNALTQFYFNLIFWICSTCCSYSCGAVDNISTDSASRGPSAAQLHVCCGCRLYYYSVLSKLHQQHCSEHCCLISTTRLRSSTENLSHTVPSTRTKLRERASSVSGPTAWNSLPNDIRKITHSNTFKRHLKFYFFNHYFYMEA